MCKKHEKFIVCPVCGGKGTTVNPNIDAHGLTREDFDDDPDFAEDYNSGMYDQVCACCDGKRVVTQKRMAEIEEHAAERRMVARENGDWESYSVANDYRFG